LGRGKKGAWINIHNDPATKYINVMNAAQRTKNNGRVEDIVGAKGTGATERNVLKQIRGVGCALLEKIERGRKQKKRGRPENYNKSSIFQQKGKKRKNGPLTGGKETQKKKDERGGEETRWRKNMI